jgi:hypothetical protein
MPLPNWDEVRHSLAFAIRAALPLQVRKAHGNISGLGLHVDAYYGSAGLYLLSEADRAKLSAIESQNIGDWPISTDWIPTEDHSQAFAKHWGRWDNWFREHLDGMSEEESSQKSRQLIRIACEAMRQVEVEGILCSFPRAEDFKVIIAEHDEPNDLSLERYGLFVTTGVIRVHGD